MNQAVKSQAKVPVLNRRCPLTKRDVPDLLDLEGFFLAKPGVCDLDRGFKGTDHPDESASTESLIFKILWSMYEQSEEKAIQEGYKRAKEMESAVGSASA